MNNYFETLDSEIKEYFKILSNEIPDFLNKYIKIKAKILKHLCLFICLQPGY